MEAAMTTTDGPIGTLATEDDHQTAAGPPPAADDLAAAADQPGVDPCDVACEAMPGYVAGDLSRQDKDWLFEHTADCRYCTNVLHGYERVDSALTRLQDYLCPTPPPPPRIGRRRAGYGRLDSPIGPLFIAATEDGVCEVGFAVNESEEVFRQRLRARGVEPVPNPPRAEGADPTALDRAARQLQEYFHGQRAHFEIPLDFTGVSPFTRSVLTATADIPFGQLSTYRDIATRVGQPRATRAVGNALGRNPIPVIIPCHRIIRSDSSLGGYTGGLAIKERLLSLEGVLVGPSR